MHIFSEALFPIQKQRKNLNGQNKGMVKQITVLLIIKYYIAI